jgi:H+/Cl- antiporter ClcA
MRKSRYRTPIYFFIASAICIVLGIIAEPLIKSNATEEQLIDNVLLNAIPFILIFVGIIVAFIGVIIVIAFALNEKISRRIYRIIERVIIVGIVLGILGMFQPWIFEFYRAGFILLLISTIAFIVWSHVSPKEVQRQSDRAVDSVKPPVELGSS